MISLSAAHAWIEQHVSRLGTETVPLEAARGRVLATPRPALAPGPPRAAIDGLAVFAAATEGATDYAPLPITATPILAGAALPAGTDAVLPPHWFEAGCTLSAIAPGHGVALPDPLTLPAGTLLGPAPLAALALRRETAIEVIRRPAVRLRVAGPKSGADALTPMLLAFIEAAGATLADTAPDLVLHAGRSGAGPDDDGAQAFDTIFARSIRIQPGETTTLGTIDGAPALLLPGDPVACFVAFALLAAPALRRLSGRPEPSPFTAPLGRKIVSGLGQVDAVRVRLEHGVALPVGPSLAAAADGLVLVAEGSEGYPAGTAVTIYRLP